MGTFSRVLQNVQNYLPQKIKLGNSGKAENKKLSFDEKIWHFWRATKTLKSVGATGNVIILCYE